MIVLGFSVSQPLSHYADLGLQTVFARIFSPTRWFKFINKRIVWELKQKIRAIILSRLCGSTTVASAAIVASLRGHSISSYFIVICIFSESPLSSSSSTHILVFWQWFSHLTLSLTFMPAFLIFDGGKFPDSFSSSYSMLNQVRLFSWQRPGW